MYQIVNSPGTGCEFLDSNCTCPDIHRHLPCKANVTPDEVDSSLDLLISLKVLKSTRSEDPFFFLVLFFLLYVYEMLARPTLCLFSIENVLKLHAPLHRTAVHNFCEKRVFIMQSFLYAESCITLVTGCLNLKLFLRLPLNNNI